MGEVAFCTARATAAAAAAAAPLRHTARKGLPGDHSRGLGPTMPPRSARLLIAMRKAAPCSGRPECLRC